MEMLKSCHHVCFTQKNNRNVSSRIVDIVTFNQILENVCDRKLRETHSNISAMNE